MTIKRGDVFRHEMPGAGGWGDPLEREPSRVLRDVRNEFVSLASARDDYGVIIDTAAWRIDQEATRQRRTELRAARGAAPLPTVVR
jgi:N-methylhydantoinase B